MVVPKQLKHGLADRSEDSPPWPPRPPALPVWAAFAFTSALAFAFATYLVNAALIGHRERTESRGGGSTKLRLDLRPHVIVVGSENCVSPVPNHLTDLGIC